MAWPTLLCGATHDHNALQPQAPLAAERLTGSGCIFRPHLGNAEATPADLSPALGSQGPGQGTAAGGNAHFAQRFSHLSPVSGLPPAGGQGPQCLWLR